MRLLSTRRHDTLETRHAQAARDVLGRPGRRVTPLAVLMAHDIACSSESLADCRPDDRQREVLLAALAERYGVAPEALLQERDALRLLRAPSPAQRLRPARSA